MSSILLHLGRILLVFQHLLLLVKPAERLGGTFRGKLLCQYITNQLVFGTLFLPTSLQHLLCSLSENV